MILKEKLQQYIDSKGLNTSEFERSIGVSKSYWRNTKSISADVLLEIVKKYPDINIDWIITGKGSMLKSEQIPSIKERLNHFLKEQNIEPSDFCNSIGMSFPYFSEMKSIPERYIKNIMAQYPKLNIGWLMSGEGSMLKDDRDATSEQEGLILSTLIEGNAVNYKLVPLLSLDAVGGLHRSNIETGGSEYVEKLIPFTDAQDKDVALTVSGESMSPTCPAGSKILIREVPQWNEYFGYGNLFVLLLTDGRRILKEVQKWQEDPKNYILCRSHNDKYPEEELPKSMIAGVWKVIKILNERGW